ncbi:META domain-containing protein [Lysobacter fragariae]
MLMPRLTAAFATALLVACTTASGSGEATPGGDATGAPTHAARPTLEGQAWSLVRASDRNGQGIAALQPLPARPLRVEFAGGRIAIGGGCNRISGGYAQQGDSLQVSALMQTKMACMDSRLMKLDDAISQRLQGALRMTGDGASLQLLTADGERLEFAAAP